MATYEDSKPFVVLQKDSKEFQSLFVEGVQKCLDHLDSKLGSLVCDPDSVQHLTKDNKRFNAHMEFTKAKYEIFLHMKSVVEEIDAAWQKKLNTMINNFLENVEILLAGMKLESMPEAGRKVSPSKSRRDQNVSPSSIISSMSPYSLLNTAKRIPVLNSFLPKSDAEDHIEKQNIEEEESSDEDNEAPVKLSPRQRKYKDIAVQKQEPETRRKKNSRKSILKTETENELHTTPSRSTRKRTAVKEVIQINDNDESNEDDNEISQVAPRTPKNVHFSIGFDVNEDLDIYSPEVNLVRSAPRRKTIVTKAPESSINTTLISNTVRTKRKTIGSGMDVTVAPSPKRIKRGTRASTAPKVIEEIDFLESDDNSPAEHYTPWQLLDELDVKIPSQPGVYELKVYKAKKTAYIGSCENLHQKITLHKVGQSSGHKHLDKFLERNKKDVQVRFERMSSVEQAKNEEMNRIRAFVEQHKTTPAYN